MQTSLQLLCLVPLVRAGLQVAIRRERPKGGVLRLQSRPLQAILEARCDLPTLAEASHSVSELASSTSGHWPPTLHAFRN